jgi:S1-C subfamily serine protease
MIFDRLHGKLLRAPITGLVAATFCQVSASEAAPVTTTSPSSPAEASAPPAASAPPVPSVIPSKSVENSVVKVFSTLRLPDLYRPWTKQSPTEISGSGAIISGKRILTNAHVVLHASQVQVQANQAGDKISAKVVAIAPGIDLAILKLEDEKFFDTHPALPMKKTLPDAKEPVLVYGYPTGGSSLSITKGIISRIEFAAYSFSVPGLRIQIDAAINPGNSGGPAVVGDEMVGLAFSRLGGTAQNIGYIIPCEEIELFLHDVADGHYDGKPAMYDDLQTLENPALRPFLHLDPSAKGMLVHRPFNSDSAYPLKEWDLITKIGDTSIDDQGMIKIGDNLRVRFAYLIQSIAKQDKVPLTIVRNGKEMQVDLPLLRRRPLVIPELEDHYPPFFIYGPIVFSEATTEFIGDARRDAKQGAMIATLTIFGSPLISRLGDKPSFPEERLVVISSPFFPHKLATGYGNPMLQVVKTVNRHPVKNLPHLVEVLRDLQDQFVTFEFNMRGGGETISFPRAEMTAATEEILNDNGIRAQGSPDVLKVWEAKGK